MSPEPFDESQLQAYIKQAQNGDTEAFGLLYDRYFEQVYRYSAFRVQKEIAEDLTADIFVKAWEKIHTYSFRKNVPFSAWLFRIARNMVIDAYRSQKLIVEMPEELDDPDEMNRADSALIRKETVQTVREAMKKLPRRYQEILTLSFIAELPHDEIARVLHMREGAVRILKFRALKKLEEALPPGFSTVTQATEARFNT